MKAAGSCCPFHYLVAWCCRRSALSCYRPSRLSGDFRRVLHDLLALINHLFQVLADQVTLLCNQIRKGTASRERIEAVEILVEPRLRKIQPFAYDVLEPPGENGALVLAMAWTFCEDCCASSRDCWPESPRACINWSVERWATL